MDYQSAKGCSAYALFIPGKGRIKAAISPANKIVFVFLLFMLLSMIKSY